MSIYSTMEITREDALYEIQNRLSSLSNNLLEDILLITYNEGYDWAPGDKETHNFSIVDDVGDSPYGFKYTRGALK